MTREALATIGGCEMTLIDELVQSRLVMLLRRERNLVLEHTLELVCTVLDRNARAYEYLGQFREATSVRESLSDIHDVMERGARLDEVMQNGERIWYKCPKCQYAMAYSDGLAHLCAKRVAP